MLILTLGAMDERMTLRCSDSSRRDLFRRLFAMKYLGANDARATRTAMRIGCYTVCHAELKGSEGD